MSWWHVHKQGRLLAALFLCLAGGNSAAHGLRNDILVEMAPLQIEGLTVEVHQDLFAPQLVISNRSGKPLQISDDSGRAFLRIGPTGTEADLAAKAFHLSRVAGGGDVHPKTLSDTPRWRAIAKEPAYGWFDARISTAAIDIPYAVKQIGKEMPFAEWRIPARLGDQAIELRGVFTYLPASTGVAMAVMQSPNTLAPGVLVQMVPGTVPVFFLSNSSKQTVAVLDAQGKPFLKIEPTGVWADLGSASWRAASTTAVPAGKGWKQISKSRSVTWREARAAWTGKPPKASAAASQLNEWRVPLVIGSSKAELRGINRWLPGKTPPPPHAVTSAKP